MEADDGGNAAPAPFRAATWTPGAALTWQRSAESLPSGAGVSVSRSSMTAPLPAAGQARPRTPPPPLPPTTTTTTDAGLAAPLLPSGDVEAGHAAVPSPPPAAASMSASAAPTVSLAVNVALLVAKLIAFYLSRSKAVLASTVDSVVDIASQAVLAAAARRAATRHPRFPVGRARMSAVGVASAAGIMVGATLLVVWESAR